MTTYSETRDDHALARQVVSTCRSWDEVQFVCSALDAFLKKRFEAPYSARAVIITLLRRKCEALVKQGSEPEDVVNNQTQNEKQELHDLIQRAKKSGQALEHMLFYGPSGQGKAILARNVAREMGVNLKLASGSSIEREADLSAILTGLEESDIVFIEDIDRLPPSVEEELCSAMENFEVTIRLGTDSTARALKIGLKPFTVIGAIVQLELLSPPLLALFDKWVFDIHD